MHKEFSGNFPTLYQYVTQILTFTFSKSSVEEAAAINVYHSISISLWNYLSVTKLEMFKANDKSSIRSRSVNQEMNKQEAASGDASV